MKNLISKLGITIIFAVIALAVIAQAAHAQDIPGLQNKTPQQRAQFQTDLMKSKLHLDTAQAGKMQAINLKYALKMEPIIKGNDGKLKKYRAAMAVQKAKDAELKKVFNAEQYKQYQAFEEDLKNKVREHFNQ